MLLNYLTDSGGFLGFRVSMGVVEQTVFAVCHRYGSLQMSDESEQFGGNVPPLPEDSNESVISERLAQFASVYGDDAAQAVLRHAVEIAETSTPSLNHLSTAAKMFFASIDSSISAEHAMAASYEFTSQPYPIPQDASDDLTRE
jgi:hypothetical protein